MAEQQTFQLDIVSPEASMFSGPVAYLKVKGAEGDIGILPGHLQLLTRLPPGVAHLHHGDEEQLFYVNGGILEVQPQHVTIMADVVQRPQDVDEAAALAAKKAAEAALSSKPKAKDFEKVTATLDEALAKLRLVELMRMRKKR